MSHQRRSVTTNTPAMEKDHEAKVPEPPTRVQSIVKVVPETVTIPSIKFAEFAVLEARTL